MQEVEFSSTIITLILKNRHFKSLLIFYYLVHVRYKFNLKDSEITKNIPDIKASIVFKLTQVESTRFKTVKTVNNLGYHSINTGINPGVNEETHTNLIVLTVSQS